MNKGDNLFIRRNLLDKAFKRWRLNSQLMKYNELINPCYVDSNNNNRVIKQNINLYDSVMK